MSTADDLERRRIIKRLIKKLSTPEISVANDDYVTAAARLTGLHPKVIKDLESGDVFEMTLEPIDRSVIYEKICYFYLKNKIPTTKELFLSLYGDIPPYIDIGNFRKILVKMDYVWKKVSPTHAVIIERPEIRFERYNYLKRIQFYRTSRIDIYYLKTASYDSNGKFRDFKLTTAHIFDVLSKDWMQRVVYAVGPEGVLAVMDINVLSEEVIENWVKDTLLPKISRPSVFLLKNDKHFCGKLVEIPTLNSLKADTMRWLDRHGVTYDPKMSKYELLALAEKYTDMDTELFKIDLMLKAGGHVVLRIPKCIESLSSAALLSRVVCENFTPEAVADLRKSNDSSSTRMSIARFCRDLLISAGTTYIEEFERHISSKEVEMLAMEDKIDEIYEGLLAKAGSTKQNDLDSDLPSCSDSE